MPICNHCGTEKSEEEFNWRWKNLGIRQPACRECQQVQRRNWYEGDANERHKRNVRERKEAARAISREFAWKYLCEHSCVDYGQSDPRVLQFDHVRGKNRDLARLIADGAPVEKIKRELELCEIRCANCHQKKTMEERGWYRARK